MNNYSTSHARIFSQCSSVKDPTAVHLTTCCTTHPFMLARVLAFLNQDPNPAFTQSASAVIDGTSTWFWM